MSYVAVKSVNLSGNKYMPGKVILDEHILPSRKRALVRNGRIAEVAENINAPVTGVEELLETGAFDGKIIIPIVKDDGSDTETAEMLAIPLTEGDVQLVFAVMQMNVEEAAKKIEEIRNEDVLIVLHSADSRQGVKKAARKQAEKLNPEETLEPKG